MTQRDLGAFLQRQKCRKKKRDGIYDERWPVCRSPIVKFIRNDKKFISFSSLFFFFFLFFVVCFFLSSFFFSCPFFLLSSTMQQRKQKQIEQGRNHIRKAKEHESTGWFKWTPEWTLAASEYEKAGSMFKMAQDYDSAKKAYFQESKAQASLGIYWSAGQSLEKAAQMAKEGGSVDEAAELMARAGNHYSTDGKYQKAADALSKAAKIAIEKPDRCLNYFSQAFDILENDDDLLKMGGEVFKMGIALYSHHRKFTELTGYLQKLVTIYFQLKQKHNVHKCFISLAIVGLASDDFVAAEAHYKEAVGSQYSMGFCSTDDAKVCIQLLHAFESGSIEELEKVFGIQMFTFLHPAIYKLTRQLIADAKTEKLESFGLVSGGAKYSAAGVEIVPFPLTDEDLKSKASDSDNRKKFLNIDTSAPFQANNLTGAQTPVPSATPNSSTAVGASSSSSSSSGFVGASSSSSGLVGASSSSSSSDFIGASSSPSDLVGASSSSSSSGRSSSRLAQFYKDAAQAPPTTERKEVPQEQEPLLAEPKQSPKGAFIDENPSPLRDEDELFGGDVPAAADPPVQSSVPLDEIL